MSTQFKVGDKAWFDGEIRGAGRSKRGEVEVKSALGGNYNVQFSDGQTWYVDFDQLTPIDQHKFKVGDRVRIIGNRTSHPDPGYTCTHHNSAQFNGKTGCIMDKARPGFGDWLIVLEGDRHYSFFADELELISGEAFNVGDRVVVNTHSYKNLTGTFLGYEKDDPSERAIIQPDDQKDYDKLYFCSKFIRLLSPQSPQPQTPKPKEDDMKRYAVIYKNMASNESPNINSVHATEAEAKLAGEQLVAGQRQELVKKNFFSVSILDTHTGTLIGSVVDAPPAVEWNAGK